MNVTAITARRNYTSAEHCVDVAEIGEDELVKMLYLFCSSSLVTHFLKFTVPGNEIC